MQSPKVWHVLKFIDTHFQNLMVRAHFIPIAFKLERLKESRVSVFREKWNFAIAIILNSFAFNLHLRKCLLDCFFAKERKLLNLFFLFNAGKANFIASIRGRKGAAEIYSKKTQGS